MAKKSVKKSVGMKYTKDEQGHDILLKDGDLQVMMEWEKPYMQACVDALKPSGDVLEIGFGLGYSASHIQKYHPKSHTIIECDPTVIKKAQAWAKKHPHVKIVKGFWQDQIGKLGVFDTIFFDDYTPFTAAEVKAIEANARALEKADKNVKKMNSSLKAAFKRLKGIKFTDAQVLDFVKSLQNRRDPIDREEVIEFIQTLVEQGNITIKQEVLFLDAFDKSKLKKTPAKKSKASESEISNDRLLNFYQLSLDRHMRKGSRMSSYINIKQFKKNYDQFEKLIASRPDVKLKEKVISVDIPSNCKYYKGNKALVLTISKT